VNDIHYSTELRFLKELWWQRHRPCCRSERCAESQSLQRLNSSLHARFTMFAIYGRIWYLLLHLEENNHYALVIEWHTLFRFFWIWYETKLSAGFKYIIHSV
jgi:hypothetical protein